jgi:hypothetical protein
MAPASAVTEIPIKFRYGLVSLASTNSVFWHHRTQPPRTESDSMESDSMESGRFSSN